MTEVVTWRAVDILRLMCCDDCASPVTCADFGRCIGRRPSHLGAGRGRPAQLNWDGSVTLPRSLLESATWLSLSLYCQAAYIALARGYDGANNGAIACSQGELARRAHMDPDTASRALHELVDAGLIECTSPGTFGVRAPPRAATWLLTAWPDDRA